MFWLTVIWWTLGSPLVSPKQSLYSFKKLRFGEPEMDSIFLMMFNCLLEFSLMMAREFVSATINNKRTFLPRCWISRVFCSFTGILLPLCALMVVADFDIPGSACRLLIYFFGIHWLEHQSWFCSRCSSNWYLVWLITQCLPPRRSCWFVGCCFWLCFWHIKNSTNEEVMFV